MSDEERRQKLVQALWVAPFISADESLRRCREAADEIQQLSYMVKALQAKLDDFQIGRQR